MLQGIYDYIQHSLNNTTHITTILTKDLATQRKTTFAGLPKKKRKINSSTGNVPPMELYT